MLHFLIRIRRMTMAAVVLLAWQTAGAQTLLPTPDLGLMIDGGVVNAAAVQADGKIVIGGQSRNRIAALDVVTSNATAWNPDADSSASGVAAGTAGVYAVGAFLSMLLQPRDGLAALSLDVALPPALQGTKSRKLHGGAGTFDLPL